MTPPVLRRIALALVALWAGGLEAQPDVVLVVADDLGWGDVGYHGAEVQTPHLDALAAEGVRLDRFYASPLCSPSRAGLLTGRYGVRMGINEPVTHADTVGLPRSETTLAELLRDVGYETAAVGKWHLGDECRQHPTEHGFDSFLGLVSGGASYFTRETQVGPDWWRGFVAEDVPGYTTDLIADEAVAILQRPRDGPLFLYLPFTAPHSPLHALEADLARYPGLEDPRRTFAAMTTAFDRAVGRVMEAVRASGRPTLVWFLSDNGAVEREGGVNAPLRGQKGQTYEGAIRVPSLVWYPPWGRRTVEHPVWYLDVLPTVAALAGAPRPPLPLDGADQGPQLAGAPPTADLLERVLFSYRRLDPVHYWLAAQTADWKFVSHLFAERPAEDLFHLARDPFETADSLRAYPARADALRAAALAFADLTLPTAAHDFSLEASAVPDLASCPAVLGLPPPTGDGALALRAGPVPMRTGATVWVEARAAARLRVTVLDARGRVVRVLLDGPVPPGETALAVPRGGLPAGVYVVRAVGEGVGASTRLVVL